MNYESQFLERNSSGDQKEEVELSGITVVLIIGGGVLFVIMFFIFAKRTLRNFATKSLPLRQNPFLDAQKSVRREIERRLDCVQKIAYEPLLIPDQLIFKPEPPFYFRQKAVDCVQLLEKEIGKHGALRPARESLRAYLITELSGGQKSISDQHWQRLIHQFCDMYDHARHDPAEFGKDEYANYNRMLQKLIDAAKTLKFSTSGSPNCTPVKKQITKVQSLLDPGRLRPPPDNEQNNIRINLALGVQQIHHRDQDIYNRIDTLDDNEILNLANYRNGSSKL